LIFSLSGIYPQARWVNYYYKIQEPSNRIDLRQIAQKLEIISPPTLVTNSYEAACNFVTSRGDNKATKHSGAGIKNEALVEN
jgi:hypothetical protein